MLAAGDGERELDPAGRLTDGPHGPDLGRRPAPVGQDRRRRRLGHPYHPRVVRVQDDAPGGRDRADERALLGQDTLDRTELLQVRGRHGGDDGERGGGDRGEGGDVARAVGPHLEHDRLVGGAELEERQREAPLVVEAPRRAQDLKARAEDAGDQLLGRRLAVRAGHADDRDVEPAPVRRRQPPEGGRRVVDEHDRHVAGQVVGQRVDDEAGGAATDRLPRERVTVEAVPADREERLADRERARVDGDAPHGHAQVAADQRAVGRPDDVLDAQHGRRDGLVHAGCLWLKIARATSRSSKGSTAGPTS